VTTGALEPLSPAHVVPVALWLVATIALTARARRYDAAARTRAAETLAIVLVGYYVVETVVRLAALDMRVADTVPLEMCSLLFFTNAFGLWTGRRTALDLMWFWTMAGVAHSFITPTPRAPFPSLHYFQYFLAHGLLLFAAIYATVGLGRAPVRGSTRRASLAFLAFVAVVGVVDAATGENYVYLRAKPPSPTLVDAFGPWPGYVFVGVGVGLASFAAWSVPWTLARRARERRALPPGPRTPGIWQLLRFAVRPCEFFDDCAARFGDVFTVDMASFGYFVMVSSPALVKQVFAGDPDVFLAGRANRDLEPLLGSRSLFLLDGAEHARHRKLVMPPLHGERMRAYAAVMRDSARAAVAAMPLGKPFALHRYMQRVALEVVLGAVFGLAEGAARDRMAAALARYLEPPSPILPFLPKLDLPLTPYRRFVRARDAVDREIYALIAERRSRGAIGERGDDVVALLLAARDEAGGSLTDGELRDELVTLLVAGHETTATASCWCIERLLAHPDALARLDVELASAAVPADLARLEYLDAVVKETLRVRPILPDVVRELAAPVQLGDWLLPVGTRVAPCIHLAHRRAGAWPEPDAFRPERFVGVKHDPYAWFPFGGGGRRCVGMMFALYEIKIVLATVLRDARFQLAASRSPRVVRRGVTLGPEGGVRVVVTEKRCTRET
jgi:hypothetical integral membrane protein (TIGR02206 family)